MAKRQRTNRRSTSPRQKPAPGPEFSFRRFWVTRAAFQEEPKVAPETESTPKAYSIQLGIAVKVLAPEDKTGRVVMTMSVLGDPRSKPYRLHMELVGEFVSKGEASRDEVISFCRDSGPTLLFPYARQIIDRMTSDGFYGAIRLDPIYLRQMLADQVWKEEPDGIESAPSGEASSTETERHD